MTAATRAKLCHEMNTKTAQVATVFEYMAGMRAVAAMLEDAFMARGGLSERFDPALWHIEQARKATPGSLLARCHADAAAPSLMARKRPSGPPMAWAS